MLKKTCLIILFSLNFLFLTFCDDHFLIKKIDSENSDDVTYQTNHTLITLKKYYLNENEIIEFAKNIENGINYLSIYLTNDFIKYDLSKKLIKIEARDVSNAQNRNGIVYLPNVKEKRALYIHELVHVLAGYSSLGWLTIGLAVYLNDEFSKYTTPPNFGKDLGQLTKHYLNSEEVSDYLNFDKVEYFYISGERHKIFLVQQIFSGSLVKYIDKKYGTEKLLKLFNSNDFQGVLNISYQDLRTEWLNYIKNL
jgi:hypothetical protein